MASETKARRPGYIKERWEYLIICLMALPYNAFIPRLVATIGETWTEC